MQSGFCPPCPRPSASKIDVTVLLSVNVRSLIKQPFVPPVRAWLAGGDVGGGGSGCAAVPAAVCRWGLCARAVLVWGGVFLFSGK